LQLRISYNKRYRYTAVTKKNILALSKTKDVQNESRESYIYFSCYVTF